MATVALVSGGVDSLVMCKLLTGQGEEVLPLFVDYGQLAAENEWEACKNVLGASDLPEPEKVDISGYGKLIQSGITSGKRDLRSDAFLPGRNLLFLVVASSYALQKGMRNVAIGLLSEGGHLFPDQTQEFIVNANFAINSALGEPFTIITPLINFNKKDVVNLARKHNLPIKKTYSCHLGKEKYCEKCIACKEIIDSVGKKGFPQFEGAGD